MHLPFFKPKLPDIKTLQERKDIRGLVRALRNEEPFIQWQAADALSELGKQGIDLLLRHLRTSDREVKLGIIQALGKIRNPMAVPILLPLLKDTSVEVRWATAIALGEIGDLKARELLVDALTDHDKYVRYGAAIALERLGWQPSNEMEKAYLHLGKQEWEMLAKTGESSMNALYTGMEDRHVDVRLKVLDTLGEIGSTNGKKAVIKALSDESPVVRWRAVLVGPKCGISLMYLPWGLNRRPRIRKNPRIAAFLNFILPGQGYNYLGFWFGTLIFQLDVTLTLYLLSYEGEQITYGILLPLYSVFAVHAWYIARKIPEM